MIGFKAFDKNLKCLDFQYEIGHTYEFDGEPIPCEQGFHFCRSIPETYQYYPTNGKTRICKVEASGDIETDDGVKYCTNKITICEEITEDWKRKGNLVSSSTGYCNTGTWNTGDWNAGDWNAGDYNVGDYNTGHRNMGDKNTGHRNTGDKNTGDKNTGDKNTGNWNTGYMNTGNYNTGNYNTGNYNAGDHNTGNRNTGRHNTGDRNTGHCNTGDWNTSDWNTGCFNTKENTIMMFDKPTEWTSEQWFYSDAKRILDNIPKIVVEWVWLEDMTDEEKEKYPTYKTTEGYLEVLDEEFIAQDYWNSLSEDAKQKIFDLPNFDKDIFKQCTGIDVDADAKI